MRLHRNFFSILHKFSMATVCLGQLKLGKDRRTREEKSQSLNFRFVYLCKFKKIANEQ